MINHNIQKEVISLEFYNPIQLSDLENYYLPPDQLKYTSLPIDAIKKCELEDERYPIMILQQNELAGFFVLHGWVGVQEYSDNKDAILLRAYSVHPNFQGQGIAKESLLLLPEFVRKHFPSKNEIVLAVNYQNKAAQHVYLKCGFDDKGIRVMGKKGELFILHMDV